LCFVKSGESQVRRVSSLRTGFCVLKSMQEDSVKDLREYAASIAAPSKRRRTRKCSGPDDLRGLEVQTTYLGFRHSF
jgi:hypothetical protein